MFNEKRIEQIRKDIQISSILTDHEKSDWLNLLDLMNDKQLGELEEILGTAPAKSAAVATQPPISQQPKPPLSHLSNVPAGLGVSTPQSSAPVQTAPPARPKQPLPTPPIKPAPTYQAPPPKRPVAPVAPTPAVLKPQAASLKKMNIETLADIEGFEVSTLREYDLQSIVDAIRTTIQSHGYFQILQQFEVSPLYRSYIETGKFMLGEGGATISDPETTLTQTEFEFITDLLRHMRFNTW